GFERSRLKWGQKVHRRILQLLDAGFMCPETIPPVDQRHRFRCIIEHQAPVHSRVTASEYHNILITEMLNIFHEIMKVYPLIFFYIREFHTLRLKRTIAAGNDDCLSMENLIIFRFYDESALHCPVDADNIRFQ